MSRGKYIVIEGNDGTGKSTQVELLEKYLTKHGIQAIQIHEPDGVPIASQIRDIILNGSLKRDALTNVLLFTAARRENWLQKVEPALKKGKWVLAARNWFSTVAYQGYGEGLDTELIKQMTKDFVSEAYLEPDMTIVLTVDDATRTKRIGRRGELKTPDTFESRGDDFQTRVNKGYGDFAKREGLITLDASAEIIEIQTQIQKTIEPLIKEAL